MAIYHFNGQVIGRISKTGQPKSPVSSAAYRSGEKLYDELENKKWDYMREVKPEAHMLAPPHAPDWVNDRERLWNEVNKIEKNYNAQLAREFNIGLPCELSHEQQRELALEFCQEAFVDRGMVADIAIHRDDKNNPHFHVMLPTRPFNEDGSWGIKAKREYIYDKDGNHVLDKNGKKTFKKVTTTDWDSKEVFLSWRKLWADKTNEYLLKNGINEKISHLSNKDRGIESLPTIHEGYAARQRVQEGKDSDRINTNKKIKEYNITVSDLKKYKEKKAIREYQNKFARKFSPMEKKALSNIAKELKMFVKVESIEERKQQLKQWKKSIQFRQDSETKLSQLERIDKEEILISEATEIFETEANRFLEKHYPNLDSSKYSTDEKIAIVENTILHNRIHTPENITEMLSDMKSENILKQVDNLIKNRFSFTMGIKQHINIMNTILVKAEQKLGANEISPVHELQAARLKNPKAYQIFRDTFRKKQRVEEVHKLMNEFYNLEINKRYPNLDVQKMTLDEKEILIVGTEYYGKPITLESISTLRRYSTQDQANIINILTNTHGSDWETKLHNESKYRDFQFDNPRFVLLFKDECLRNIKELPDDERQLFALVEPELQAFDKISKELNLEDINTDINNEIHAFSSNLSTATKMINGVAGALFEDLLESRDYKSKKQFEEDLNAKSKKAKKRSIHSSGPSL
ncbi:MobA/MobL family protein [Terribacillus saccharophilus]|uniref:MobA/MobL family protein n=1 Tax=Terribacillus saccharophilus TaxID=361277 RepID=A0AAX2EJS7_9BACI|nr:MobA/MobL family protein [Terribacillus saccharophilus]